jgi:hypothetical protein
LSVQLINKSNMNYVTAYNTQHRQMSIQSDQI